MSAPVSSPPARSPPAARITPLQLLILLNLVCLIPYCCRAKKLLNLRLFEDPATGKAWDKSVSDLNLEILCVSQVRQLQACPEPQIWPHTYYRFVC